MKILKEIIDFSDSEHIRGHNDAVVLFDKLDLIKLNRLPWKLS